MIEGVIAVGVGRNLNRIIRTSHSFGVNKIFLLSSAGKLTGHLFSARGNVEVIEIADLSMFGNNELLALEVSPSIPDIRDVNVDGVRYIVVGGESVTLRKNDFRRMARIPTHNRLCLTSEAAIAIGLYKFIHRENRP